MDPPCGPSSTDQVNLTSAVPVTVALKATESPGAASAVGGSTRIVML